MSIRAFGRLASGVRRGRTSLLLLLFLFHRILDNGGRGRIQIRLLGRLGGRQRSAILLRHRLLCGLILNIDNRQPLELAGLAE